MNKVGFFYSIFCNDSIEQSIRYLVPFVTNVKKYNENNLIQKDYYIILHTDKFTFDVINRIANQENVSLKNIIVKIHTRNLYLRGMIWRFESCFTNEYDICINAEGDWPIEKYMSELEFFKNSNYAYILHNVRQFEVSNKCFAGGNFMIKPKLIDANIKERVRLITSLIENIEYVHYGIDEIFFVKFAKKYLSKLYGLIVINDTIKIFQHIENFETEKTNVEKVFNNSTILCQKEFNNKLIPTDFNTKITLKYSGQNKYTLENKVINYNDPLRFTKTEWGENELVKIIELLLVL